MPIPVVCPGCKASFSVSDKFAGKQGPCPKCKTPITIPKLTAAKPAEEIKIHAPEEATGGPKGSSGRPVLKPITRTDVKLNPYVAGGIVVGIIGLYLLAWFLGDFVKRPYPLEPAVLRDQAVAAPYYKAIYTAYAIRAVVLMLISLPVVWAGYMILRDDELDPFRGRALWTRVGICFAVYMLIWGVYALLPADYVLSWYVMAMVAIPMFLIGFTAAYFCFEFDPTSAGVHFLFFVVVTLMLGATAGLTMPWSEGLKTLPYVPMVQEGVEAPRYTDRGEPINEAARKEEAERLKAERAAATATAGS